jgi:3-phosphoshikimate 1-carboxyvinyltransferase
MLGAIAHGTTRITNLAPGADVAATMACFRELGVAIEAAGPDLIVIKGGGLGGTPSALRACWTQPNSGTTLRLMTGLLAGGPGPSRSRETRPLRRRPMGRVIEPLAAMGASIGSEQGKAPLSITGGPLTGIEWRPPVASAQIKSALMLAGCQPTAARLCTKSRRRETHSELAFPAFGLQASINGSQHHRAWAPGGDSALGWGARGAWRCVVGGSLGPQPPPRSQGPP